MKKQVEITKVSWNVHAAQGWFAVVISLLGMAAYPFVGFSEIGFVFGSFGLIGGGALVTWAGPLRQETVYRVGI